MENYSMDYLSHHGTKGMRWGVRRYQNHDGSLTDAGRKRYGDDSDSSKPKMSFGEKRAAKKKAKEAEARKQARLEAMRKGKEAKQKAAEEEAKKQAETEVKKQKVLESRSAKEIYENAYLFTNEELNTAYQRLMLERNISNLAPREVSKGEKFIKGVINTANTVSSVAEAGTKLYNHMARLHNSLGDSNDKWPIIKDNDQKKGGNNNGDKKKDKGNNQNNSGNKKDKNKSINKGGSDKHKDTAEDKTGTNKKEDNVKDSKSQKREKKEKTEKTETWEGTVEGKGTSTSNIKNGNDWFNSKDWDDVPYSYYKETTSIVPSSRVAEDWIYDYLERF